MYRVNGALQIKCLYNDGHHHHITVYTDPTTTGCCNERFPCEPRLAKVLSWFSSSTCYGREPLVISRTGFYEPDAIHVIRPTVSRYRRKRIQTPCNSLLFTRDVHMHIFIHATLAHCSVKRLRKEDNDWVKKCVEYRAEGSRLRGRPKRTYVRV